MAASVSLVLVVAIDFRRLMCSGEPCSTVRLPPSTCIDLGVNSLGWENSVSGTSLGAITTRMPTSVSSNSRSAKAIGRRTQPCEAGWPGSTPACRAMPVQVMRCMNGMLPSW